MQSFIFLAATIKYFVISACIPTSLVYWIVQNDKNQTEQHILRNELSQSLTFVFMFLIIGNIVDNRRKSQKTLLIIFEALFALSALLLSIPGLK